MHPYPTPSDQLQARITDSTAPLNIVITTHKNPDGDALGSSLGLQHYLTQYGHKVQIMISTDYPTFLNFLPAIETIAFPKAANSLPTQKGLQKDTVLAADMIFFLDFNDLRRIDQLGEWVRESKAYKVLIDHHLFPEDFADFVVSDTTASSTCELVLEFIRDTMHDGERIDSNVAKCLMTGILTDTGSFNYAVSPRLFRNAAALFETNLDYAGLQNALFNSDEEKRLRLQGYILSSCMFVYEEWRASVVILTQNDFLEWKIERGDTEGFVNLPLKLGKVDFAVLISDQKTVIKLSFRSKGGFDVQAFAAKYFNGGGHRNASGGEFRGTLSAAWVHLRRALETHFAEVD